MRPWLARGQLPAILSPLIASAVISAALLWASHPALAQFGQQGVKLVGTGAGGNASQGVSVALSGDGSTALVGGVNDVPVGAAWVFTRNATVWSQQTKLVGGNTIGSAFEGISVALSADGSTAIVGGPGDNNNSGAAWVFTRSGGVWSQQGGKLVGTGAVGNALQGVSVALSGDGNTAIVGGDSDNSTGAAWFFTRSGGVWSQQTKLVGTGAVGNAAQGVSVALSGDGNTAIVGGPGDNSSAGAAWVFTRNRW
jgi:FG-GAP repeat